MNNTVIIIAAVAVIVVVLAAVRIKRSNRAMGNIVSDWCREQGVIDVPFDTKAAVRDVMSGRRPGIPRDGQWWVAMGIEQIGQPLHTRLMEEGAAESVEAVHANIEEMFNDFGGTAVMPPHLAEGRFIGTLPGDHNDVVYARITGRLRPLGAWLVAVPPWLVGQASPQRRLDPVPSRPTKPEASPAVQRSNVPPPRMGIPIDLEEYQTEITEGRRPGLPQDGRYWVAMIESNEDESRLVWEQAATYHQAKNFVKELESNYRKKPQRINSYNVDDVGGVWMAEARGMPYGMLAIFHPIQLKYSYD